MNDQLKGYEARRVRIYVTEDDRIGKSPAADSIVAFLRLNHAAGVTVFRAMEGFGASGRPHTAHPDVSWNLPITIDWVDRPERVNALLPELEQQVPAGMITVEPTEVIVSACATVRPVSDAIPVGVIMTHDVTSVRLDTPIREVVELMRARNLRALPVVDDDTVAGIITNSDLVRRAKLGVRLTLMPGLPAIEQARRLDELPDRVASEIMTAPAIKVPVDYPLSEVAVIMVQRRLKRLPVVDAEGKLAGMVSRVDLLQTVADFGEKQQEVRRPVEMCEDDPVSSVMREDVPTVAPDAPLHEVVQAVTSTRLDRALVVDSNRRVLGIVNARAVLERVTPALHPSLLRSLVYRLPFLRGNQEELAAERHASARTAVELMNTEVFTSPPDAPLRQVISAMLEGNRKLVAVVDDKGSLLGVVDRADVLRGIVNQLT